MDSGKIWGSKGRNFERMVREALDDLYAQVSNQSGSQAQEPASTTYLVPLWAEENSTLGASNTYEWAFGNGANTPAGGGVLIYVPNGQTCAVKAMGVKMNNTSGSATVELVHNGTPQGSSARVVATSNGGALSELSTPLSISNGDMLNFLTSSSSGTSSPCTAVAWLEYTA
jgi:hypothetical protein